MEYTTKRAIEISGMYDNEKFILECQGEEFSIQKFLEEFDGKFVNLFISVKEKIS